MARLKLIAVLVMFTLGLSLSAPAALATTSNSPLVCTNSSNNTTSSDGSMGVKATAGTCPNGTNNAWAGYDAFKGGVYQVTGTVGTACGQAASVTNAQDFWFGEADYGSGCVPGGKYNFALNTSLSYQWPSGYGGFGTGGVTVVGWSGNCNTYGSGSACTAETEAS